MAKENEGGEGGTPEAVRVMRRPHISLKIVAIAGGAVLAVGLGVLLLEKRIKSQAAASSNGIGTDTSGNSAGTLVFATDTTNYITPPAPASTSGGSSSSSSSSGGGGSIPTANGSGASSSPTATPPPAPRPVTQPTPRPGPHPSHTTRPPRHAHPTTARRTATASLGHPSAGEHLPRLTEDVRKPARPSPNRSAGRVSVQRLIQRARFR